MNPDFAASLLKPAAAAEPAGPNRVACEPAVQFYGYKSWEMIGEHFFVFYPEADLKNRKPWQIAAPKAT